MTQRGGDDLLEDLLREAFDDARARGQDGLAGVQAGAFARAGQLRRRRAVVTGTGAGLAAAAVVAGVVLAPGLWGNATQVLPASPTTSGASTGRASAPASATSTPTTAKAVPAAYGGAYEIPDVLGQRLPGGLRMFAPDAMHTLEPSLMGNLGGCDWSGDVRKPVAGRDWQLTNAQGDGWRAGLSIAGFATGTGAQALEELLDHRLSCELAEHFGPVDWPGGQDASRHLYLREEVRGGMPTAALAVVGSGDLVVTAFVVNPDAESAMSQATAVAEGAVRELKDFAPAKGEPMGTSREAPNAASEPGAVAAGPNGWQNAYTIGDVYPTVDELGHGMRYQGGEPSQYPRTPAASGAQICDSSAVAEAKGVEKDTSPDPVAGSQSSAWAGGGGAEDANTTISITGWESGTGPARFADLQHNTGGCVWMPGQQRLTWAGADPASTWLSRSTEGPARYLASQRVGDVIVSVVVGGLPGDTERSEAIRLSNLVAAKLRASGLPAAEGK